MYAQICKLQNRNIQSLMQNVMQDVFLHHAIVINLRINDCEVCCMKIQHSNTGIILVVSPLLETSF